jgi:hypothetical protein
MKKRRRGMIIVKRLPDEGVRHQESPKQNAQWKEENEY